MTLAWKKSYGGRHIIAGGCMLGLALFLAAAPAFAGKPHYVVVRIYKNEAVSTHIVQVNEERQVDYSGNAHGQRIQFQFLPARNRTDADAPLSLQYSFMIGKTTQGQHLSKQGEVLINPGSNITVLKSGPWKVKIALDTKKNIQTAAWEAKGLSHYLVFRFYKDQAVSTHIMQVKEGAGTNCAVKGESQNIIIQSTLIRNPANIDAPLVLQYALEVAPVDLSNGRGLQVQGEVAINPGSNITVAECGPWKVKIALDTQKNIQKAAWDAEGLQNYRFTADTRIGGKKQLYRMITVINKTRTAASVSDFIPARRKYGFIFQTILSPDKAKGFKLQYMAEQGFHNPARPFQRQSELTLTPGKKAEHAGQGYYLKFLLEDKPPAPEKKGGEPGPRAKSEYGTIPIIQ